MSTAGAEDGGEEILDDEDREPLEESATVYFYVLEGEAQGVDVEVWLNGIPISLRGPSFGPTLGMPVNHLVIDNINEVSCILCPGPYPSWARVGVPGPRPLFSPSANQSLDIALKRYPKGAIVGGPNGQTLLELQWPKRDYELWNAPVDRLVDAYGEVVDDEFEPAPAPLVLTQRDDLGPIFGRRWAFQDAPKLTLDDALIREALAFVEAFREPLEMGDPSVFLDCTSVRLRETARAFSRDPREKIDTIKYLVSKDAMRPDFRIPKIDPRLLDLRLCAQGRLLAVTAFDFFPALRELPDAEGSVGYYDLLLGRLSNGSLHALR